MLSTKTVAGALALALSWSGVTDPGFAEAGSLTLPPVAALIDAEKVE